MKNMLSFDISMITRKKSIVWILVANSLGFLLVSPYLWKKILHNNFVLTAIFTGINILAILYTLLMHQTSDNQQKSNYISCVYFPVKKRHYFFSKIIIVSLVLLYNQLMIFVVQNITKELFHVEIHFNEKAFYIVINIVIVLLTASILMISNYFTIGYRISLYSGMIFISGLCGSLCYMYIGNDGMKTVDQIKTCTLVIVTGAVIIWIMSIILSRIIANKISA